ncbi:MAG: gamma-glutamylcyclotransferase family protein [Leucothrix sp.]
MLRILLWKLGFEWANLMRLLRPQHDQRIYYFAFGANLSPSVLTQRRMTIYDTVDYALDDATLRFSQPGFYKDHAYASADAATGEKVYGKLYLIKQSDARRMDYFEGEPFLQVHDKIFREYKEMPFYYYRAVAPVEGLKPTQEYLDYITMAYRKMDSVPDAYTEAMEATEVLSYFEQQDKTGQFIRDIERWPKRLHPVLIKYEAICQQVVEWLWNRSLIDWMIKV